MGAGRLSHREPGWGDPTAIARTQRSSARYYQRPDAEHFSLDTTRTALAGYNAVASLTKLSGRWMGSLTLQDESPGYETSDVGFEVYTNRRAVATDVGYATYRPGRLFRNYRADLFTTHEWDYDWNRITFDIGLNQSARFRNFWQVNLVTHLYPATMDDHLTRGGPREERYRFAVYGREQGTITPDGSGAFTVDPDGAGAAEPFTVPTRAPTSDRFRLRARLPEPAKHGGEQSARGEAELLAGSV